MKKKIIFTISVNSFWPDQQYPSQIIFPKGGDMETRTIEFDTAGGNPMDDALRELHKVMGSTPYHIWYWDWITGVE